MTGWITRGKRVTIVEFNRSFMFTKDYLYEGEPTAGYSFPCNESGELLGPNENYERCLTGVIDGKVIEDFGIRRYEHSYWEPGLIRCYCGAEVVIDRVMTNTCDRCARDYNWAGQLLAPREQWGEETGETAADILAADRMLT